MDLSAVNYTHMGKISRSLYMLDSGVKSLFVTWEGGGDFYISTRVFCVHVALVTDKVCLYFEHNCSKLKVIHPVVLI
jgi:hypothetical protein